MSNEPTSDEPVEQNDENDDDETSNFAATGELPDFDEYGDDDENDESGTPKDGRNPQGKSGENTAPDTAKSTDSEPKARRVGAPFERLYSIDDESDRREFARENGPWPSDQLGDDFRLGDPVIDAATGRAMVVVEKLADSVLEYDDYDLLGNYAAQRCRVSPTDPVYGTIYVSSVQSEPSGPRYGDPPYAFASSRLNRPTIESVDGFDRVYTIVARDVLRRLFDAALGSVKPEHLPAVDVLARDGGFNANVVESAKELAEVERRAREDSEADDE